MTRKAKFPQSPRHVMVYDQDWEFLQNRFGRPGGSDKGAGSVLKDVIHTMVMRMRAREDLAIDAMEEGTEDAE